MNTASSRQPPVQAALRRYWRNNVLIMLLLLLIWAAVSLGCGVAWANYLNRWKLPGTGFPLGFWFAQQGSIVMFVLLIWVYAAAMNVLDRRHHLEVERINTPNTTAPPTGKDAGANI